MGNLKLSAEQYFSLDGFNRPGSGICLDNVPFVLPFLAEHVEGMNKIEQADKAWAFSSFMIFNHLPLNIQAEVLLWGWQETETRGLVGNYLVRVHFNVTDEEYSEQWESRFKALVIAQDTPINFDLMTEKLKKE